MKIKNKIFTLLGVFTLVGLTHSLTLKDLNASLSAPASYDINYQYDALYEETFVLGSTSIGTYSPLYTRTADGSHYNYSTIIDNTDSSILPLGLEITMTFNRSNTNWFSITGGYIPADTKIGSSNGVGTILNKTYLEFDNQTNKNYLLYLDYSSSTTTFISLQYNSLPLGSYNLYLYSTNDSIHSVYLPSYTNVKLFNSSTNTARYFDAWYLKDLGVSDSYDAGYDAGELIGYDDGYADGLGNNPNVLLNGFQAMVGILVNFMLMILNLEVFNVSIMSVFGILALFVGVIWILKIVRG
jgi:hypothetical protein